MVALDFMIHQISVDSSRDRQLNVSSRAKQSCPQAAERDLCNRSTSLTVDRPYVLEQKKPAPQTRGPKRDCGRRGVQQDRRKSGVLSLGGLGADAAI